MPQFILDTSGRVQIKDAPQQGATLAFDNLDAFTQGYIEALFFTEEESLRFPDTGEGLGGRMNDGGVGFSDLAPAALADIIADCEAFKNSPAWYAASEAFGNMTADEARRNAFPMNEEAQAGHDFWLTRNGHGAGFWDGDWPEPYASKLDAAAKAAGSLDAYLGDDGKVYVS